MMIMTGLARIWVGSVPVQPLGGSSQTRAVRTGAGPAGAAAPGELGGAALADGPAAAAAPVGPTAPVAEPVARPDGTVDEADPPGLGSRTSAITPMTASAAIVTRPGSRRTRPRPGRRPAFAGRTSGPTAGPPAT